MMNESHAGTEQATGWKRWIKRQIVKRFDAALVAGDPQKRHFASLGIPADKIFTGYDAVDNDFFASRADEVRAAAKKSRSASAPAAANGSGVTSSEQAPSIREAYGLPERYFLSLGRMVEKKNLATLVAAYARYVQSVAEDGRSKIEDGEAPVALVFVGSGELESVLREQARGLGLRVIDRTDWKAGQSSHRLTRIDADKSERLAADRTGGDASCRVTPGLGDSPREKTEDSKLAADDSAAQHAAVYFYGFRQIEENPVFYALAEAFVLPSLKEEWGLVVNEAMAAGLPVIVSRAAGCAEDLVPKASAGGQVAGDGWRVAGKDAGDSLEQRSNGFVFDPKSSDALSEALKRIAVAGERLKVKGNELTEMGKRSREIVAKFSCENFAKQALRAAEAAIA